MAAYNKIPDWVENEAENVDAASDQFVVALSNTAPSAESTDPTGDSDGVLANVTEIGNYANLSGATPRNLTTNTSAQTNGTYKLDFNDLVLTASGGNVGPFRYIYVYDDTVASPVDPLVCYYDHGSSITLADTETYTIAFSASGFYTKT